MIANLLDRTPSVYRPQGITPDGARGPSARYLFLPRSYTMAQPLQSVPLQSSISPTFWSELTKLKLHEFKLDDAPIPITHARYSASRRVKDRLKGSETGVDGTLDLADYSLRATTATNER